MIQNDFAKSLSNKKSALNLSKVSILLLAKIFDHIDTSMNKQ